MKHKAIVLATVVLLLAVGVGVLALYYLSIWLRGLEPGVAAAVVTGAVGLFGLWYAQWATRSREIAESHRTAKIEVYNVFLDIVDHFNDHQTDNKSKGAQTISKPLKEQFRKLNRGMIIWGSPAVIKAWMDFRLTAGSNPGSKVILVKVDAMYQAIRKDLGNSNWGLQSGDLIKSTLSDPENW